MPITPIQKSIGKLLAQNRHEESYLAGGGALLALPNSKRYSQDLDYFHDNESQVVEAYRADKEILENAGFTVQNDLNQPGYIRSVVRLGNDVTKIEWAKDSSYRFMPVEKNNDFGYLLHPIDTATNKILALAGRDEPRDLLDTLYIHNHILDLGPLVWAAVSKDPGYSPDSLLEMLGRRGKIQPEELMRLDLTETPDLTELKHQWIKAQESAREFIRSRPFKEVGCLYYSKKKKNFINPMIDVTEEFQLHYARPGGVIPNIALN